MGRLTLPIDPITGKPRRLAITGVDEGATYEKFEAAKLALKVSGNARTRNPSLAEYLGQWQKGLTVRPRTADSYRSNCRLYILPAIGKVKLSHLTTNDIRKLQRFVLQKGLSSTTARTAQTVLTVALNQAVADRLMDWNPSSALKRLAADVIDEKFLTVAQTRQVLAHVVGDRMIARWTLALLTGCRQGEALGLERSRVILTPGAETVDLSWQLQRLVWAHGDRCLDAKTGRPACERKRGADCPTRQITIPHGFEMRVVSGGLVLTRPKTGTSNRRVPLVEPLLSMIRDRYAAAGLEHNPNDLMFTQEAHRRIYAGDKYRDGGAPYNPAEDNRRWHRLLVAAGVEEQGILVYTLHSTRHSAISTLSALRVPLAVRMQITGHASSRVHSGYDHNEDLSEAREALAALGTLFTSADD